MKKITAMSPMGYGICAVILLGFIMIISAPMIIDNIQSSNNNKSKENTERFEERNFEERSDKYINITEELHRIESNLSSRIDQLESAASSENSSSESSEKISNKYICTIDKSPEGQLEPVNGEPRKFIFVCEYKE